MTGVPHRSLFISFRVATDKSQTIYDIHWHVRFSFCTHPDSSAYYREITSSQDVSSCTRCPVTSTSVTDTNRTGNNFVSYHRQIQTVWTRDRDGLSSFCRSDFDPMCLTSSSVILFLHMWRLQLWHRHFYVGETAAKDLKMTLRLNLVFEIATLNWNFMSFSFPFDIGTKHKSEQVRKHHRHSCNSSTSCLCFKSNHMSVDWYLISFSYDDTWSVATWCHRSSSRGHAWEVIPTECQSVVDVTSALSRELVLTDTDLSWLW